MILLLQHFCIFLILSFILSVIAAPEEGSVRMPPVVEPLPVKGAYLITHDRPRDNRGYFNELYNVNAYPDFIKGSVSGEWRQVAVSMTEQPKTIRGLHMSPYNKFCSVLTGGIYDVIVDMREDSPTFLKWSAVHLTEENQKQVHIPAFCLHGFMSILPDTRMLYLQGGTFAADQEKDCNPFDALLGVHWPLEGVEPIISDKDRNAASVVHATRWPRLAGRAAMPRVLIIGASGQVGSALRREYAAHGYLVYGTHSAHPIAGDHTIHFDLEAAAADPALADALLTTMRPEIVFVCAAFTWVDGAEAPEARAKVHAVNVAGPAAVAAAAKRAGAKLVAYSSEYVWDGEAGPYSEDDAPNAVNVYGQSKVEMEQRILAEDPSALLLRTTVVYGPERQGKNFVYQLCRQLAAGKPMDVVTDQVSSPTYSRDLAELSRRLVAAGARGVFNACGSERLGRHAFAVLVASALHLDVSLLKPRLTAELQRPQAARRPLEAGMRIDKALAFLGGSFRPRTVQEALADWRGHVEPGDVPLPMSPPASRF
eukprot:TRINITY_DN64040_c0_g1_i1.p1 TRINITY_DN64040_c0_g1~~TRINITY_DN64040_c0_g1_i1.p1  ORF type:complete len:539 (-),score=87.09 TRINITY_DN64040_c0_g1_i1:44-1660(-)